MVIKKKTLESLMIMLCMAFLIIPDGLTIIISSINIWGSYIVLVIFFIFSILNILTYKKMSLMSIILIALSLWLSITTYFNKPQAFTSSAFNFVRVVAICLIFEYYQNRIMIFIKGCRWFYFIMVFTNFVCVLLTYPNGIYTRNDGNAGYFLGYHNAFILYFIPALLLALLERKCKKRYCRYNNFYIIFIFCFIPTILEKSTTTLLALFAVLLIYTIIGFKNKLRNHENYCKPYISVKKMLIVYLACNIIILALNFLLNNRIIRYFVENILGKSLNFSGRTIIWQTAITMIINNPWTGFGIGSNVLYYGAYWYGHNEIIEYMLEGGMIAVFLFVGIWIALSHNLDKCKSNVSNMTMSVILPAILIFFLTEASTLQHFTIVYLIGYNLEKYLRNSNETI